jgi:putative endonuclease
MVYVLWSERLQMRYTGSTNDLAQRMKEHNTGGHHYTKRGLPWTLIHTEELPDKTSARKRENYLKTGAGREWLDSLYPQYRRKKDYIGVVSTTGVSQQMRTP